MKTTDSTELPWTGGPACPSCGVPALSEEGRCFTCGAPLRAPPVGPDDAALIPIIDPDPNEQMPIRTPEADALARQMLEIGTALDAAEMAEEEGRKLEQAQRWVADMANHCVGEWRSTGCDVSRPGYALVPVEDFEALVEAVDAWKQASERYLAALWGGK